MQDLKDMETGTDHQFALLRSDVREMEARLSTKIVESRNTIIVWLIGAVGLVAIIQHFAK